MRTSVIDLLAASIQNRRAELEAQAQANELEEDRGLGWGGEGLDEERTDGAADQEPPHVPIVGQRRPHPGDDLTPTQRKAKYARITEETCNTYNLRGTNRDEVRDFSAVR
jgi:hypothetical protein